jgi:hypothetical protein
VAFKSGNLYRANLIDNRARTLETEHFLIHYTLRGIHRVRTVSEDSTLVRISDSLYNSLGVLTTARRDSSVFSQLDKLHASHPVYILKTAEEFERAWKYYVVSLGMKAPKAEVLSVQYNVSSSLPQKFPVDIVDVGSADRDFFGETYAVTYPPSRLSITFENDFLWDTKLDSMGVVQGKSIKSQVAGKVLHDYVDEWGLGIKVTAFHEFYHAIQFTYNPFVVNYHAWYEISAVGMEERNAPEVNDYFQYLPCVLKNHDRVSLTTMSQGPCSHSPNYGHGIFHIFLSHALDSTFDVKVWDNLSRNGDVLRTAMDSAFAKYEETMSSLYPEYVSQLFFSGSRFDPLSVSFSPDMPLWADISVDSLDMSGATPFRNITVPALTFSVLKVVWNDTAPALSLQAKGITGITRIHANSTGSIVEHLQESQFILGAPKTGFKEYYLVIPNSSFSSVASVEIKEPEAIFYAFPNPIRTTGSTNLFFSQAKDMAFPARVEIYAENGLMVRALTYPTPDVSLTWDLKDEARRTVKPGIYYYRLGLETLRPFVILR